MYGLVFEEVMESRDVDMEWEDFTNAMSRLNIPVPSTPPPQVTV